MGEQPLDGVLAAERALRQARDALGDAVARARAGGASWAEVGAVLGVTRQAAFKRFGSPRDPRTGEAMTTRTSARDVVALTQQAFALIDAGDHGALASLMSPAACAVLTRDVVLGTWADAVADTGNLVRVRDVGVQLPDGTPLDDDETVIGSVVGHAVLECEAGEWVGRLAVDPGGRIAGLLIVRPGSGDLPF